MIDTKKEQERDELHRAIWAIADELRGNRAFIETLPRLRRFENELE